MRSVDRYGQMFLRSLLLRMKELGVSQSELAARMKASRPYVSKALHRFAKALQLDFFPQLVQPATGARYASSLPSYQLFPAMGAAPMEGCPTQTTGQRSREVEDV